MEISINDKNVVIANFIGKKFIQEKLGWMDVEMELLEVGDLRFDIDWNWLMPVILKIKNNYMHLHKLSAVFECFELYYLRDKIKGSYTIEHYHEAVYLSCVKLLNKNDSI